jgi:hypothetical protein
MTQIVAAVSLVTWLWAVWPAAGADKPTVVDMWPGKAPDEAGGIGPEKDRMSPKLTRKEVEVTEPTRLVTNVSKPTLTVYRPPKDKDTGTAVLICPGGGYWNLYWQLEGEEVAAWLTSHGVTGIILKPGVAYCLRTFYELVRDLIERAWVRFVQKLNANKLGNATDLGTFLFGQERASLDAYRPILVDVQKGACLYCGKPLSRRTQVDHFVPWSRYPADLGHNFVVAHDKCNSAKSAFLAAENHLAAWNERNNEHQAEFQARLVEGALPCDLTAIVQIAKWVYQQTGEANGQVWVMEKVLKHLTPEWTKCFAA